MFSDRLMARSDQLREAEQATFEVFCAAVGADARFPLQHRRNGALALWAMGRGIAGMAASFPDGQIPSETIENLLAGASYLINHHD